MDLKFLTEVKCLRNNVEWFRCKRSVFTINNRYNLESLMDFYDDMVTNDMRIVSLQFLLENHAEALWNKHVFSGVRKHYFFSDGKEFFKTQKDDRKDLDLCIFIAHYLVVKESFFAEGENLSKINEQTKWCVEDIKRVFFEQSMEDKSVLKSIERDIHTMMTMDLEKDLKERNEAYKRKHGL